MDCGCVLSGVYIVLYHKRSVVGQLMYMYVGAV